MTAMISFIQPGRLWMMSVIPVLLLAHVAVHASIPGHA